MSRKSLIEDSLASSNDRPFAPDAYLAAALATIYRIEGRGMYRLLRAPASRRLLLRQADRVESAWRGCERLGRWSGFVREVNRLIRLWWDLLIEVEFRKMCAQPPFCRSPK